MWSLLFLTITCITCIIFQYCYHYLVFPTYFFQLIIICKTCIIIMIVNVSSLVMFLNTTSYPSPTTIQPLSAHYRTCKATKLNVTPTHYSDHKPHKITKGNTNLPQITPNPIRAIVNIEQDSMGPHPPTGPNEIILTKSIMFHYTSPLPSVNTHQDRHYHYSFLHYQAASIHRSSMHKKELSNKVTPFSICHRKPP